MTRNFILEEDSGADYAMSFDFLLDLVDPLAYCSGVDLIIFVRGIWKGRYGLY